MFLVPAFAHLVQEILSSYFLHLTQIQVIEEIPIFIRWFMHLVKVLFQAIYNLLIHRSFTLFLSRRFEISQFLPCIQTEIIRAVLWSFQHVLFRRHSASLEFLKVEFKSMHVHLLTRGEVVSDHQVTVLTVLKVKFVIQRHLHVI